jgi:hypothetical protein
MVYICYGQRHKRLVLDVSRFYSREELFRMSRDCAKGVSLFLEYENGIYAPLSCDVELRFACSLVEGFIRSHQSDEDIDAWRDMLADAAHTLSCEARTKQRKPKSHGYRHADRKNIRQSSSDDTMSKGPVDDVE